MVRRLLMVAGFLFMGAAATVNAQPQPQAEPQPGACNLTSTYPVVSVNPYTTTHQGGFPVGTPQTRGAVLHVQAQPGLTSEWLQRSVEASVANGDCGFARDTRVNVNPAGDGLDIVLSNPNENAARRIVNQAEQLQQR
jgi:hypothetical protein